MKCSSFLKNSENVESIRASDQPGTIPFVDSWAVLLGLATRMPVEERTAAKNRSTHSTRSRCFASLNSPREPGSEYSMDVYGHRGSSKTVATSSLTNLLQDGCIGLSKKCSTNARKNDDDNRRYADILASIRVLIRPSFCSATR